MQGSKNERYRQSIYSVHRRPFHSPSPPTALPTNILSLRRRPRYQLINISRLDLNLRPSLRCLSRMRMVILLLIK